MKSYNSIILRIKFIFKFLFNLFITNSLNFNIVTTLYYSVNVFINTRTNSSSRTSIYTVINYYINPTFDIFTNSGAIHRINFIIKFWLKYFIMNTPKFIFNIPDYFINNIFTLQCKCFNQLQHEHFCQHINLYCNQLSYWIHLWHL